MTVDISADTVYQLAVLGVAHADLFGKDTGQ